MISIHSNDFILFHFLLNSLCLPLLIEVVNVPLCLIKALLGLLDDALYRVNYEESKIPANVKEQGGDHAEAKVVSVLGVDNEIRKPEQVNYDYYDTDEVEHFTSVLIRVRVRPNLHDVESVGFAR
jgi:hypothetical protein